MTAPGGMQQPQRSSAMKRYGPVIGIVVVVAVIAAVAIIGGRNSSNETATKTTGPSGPAASVKDVPITYAEAKAAGKEKDYQWPDNCDTTTGRLKIPTVYAPPCLPKSTGDNGGATSQGVTKDEITVVSYVPPPNGDITAMFTAQLDPQELQEQTGKAFLQMMEDQYQLNGRKVKIVRFDASGAPQDALAAHADAVTVVDKYKPFASIGGPALTPAYAEELARQGVLCIGCGLALPDQFYQDKAPHIWGALPSPEEFLQNLGDYITKRALGRKAAYAGDDDLKAKDRVFGTINFEQDPPVFTAIGDAVRKCGAKQGWTAAASESYIFDIGKMPERAPTIIAKMKEAGVTTIIFIGDPIMPIYLTRAAEAANYHPEWIITGTPLVDTTVLGRFYEPNQWQHAFGLSNLAVRTQLEQQEPYRLHQWYYGQPPVASKTSALIYPGLSQLMLGIHMAGPKLSPETFKAGLFHYPESGGGVTTPHISYGDHGYFKKLNPDTCAQQEPRLDFLASDDMVEIWWDAKATGPDEQGKSDKPGMWRYANNGKRYLPGTMPATDPDVFKTENTLTMVDQVPANEQPPQYPSPNKPLPT